MSLRDTDPYGGHHIVVHTFPNEQEKVYPALLGSRSPFTGASLQMAWNAVHERTLRWVLASSQAKKPWVVANDEQGPAGLGVPPDPGYGASPERMPRAATSATRSTTFASTRCGAI